MDWIEAYWEDLTPDWMLHAACKGKSHEDFFLADEPQFQDSRREKELAGLKVCQGCPVTEECLDYAIANRIHSGVWGGKITRERKAIARKRRVTQAV